ncbi:MAG TPA: hypothetical protein VJS63_03255 [Bradyrhizobium sp.]|nr:hypothetical protein [Bradyrhizobium sp.]
MKLFTGWVLAAGLVAGATAAQAQMAAPYRGVSDFSGPYGEAPYYREDADRGGPYYAPPQEAPPPPRYGYGYGTAAPALLPVQEVYTIIREAGFSPLGIPQQHGYIYTIAVIDRGGEDGRLVIDARNGQIMRFTPAWRTSGRFSGAYNAVLGRPGPMPPEVTEIRGPPRPPAPVPRVASRTVPVPKANPLGSRPVAEAPPVKAVETPAAKPVEPTPAPQQSAAVQTKPAETSLPPAATPTVGQAKPAAAAIQPTQEMPRAQGLD